MEPFTLDRNFQKVDIIDEFGSIIWTERYYGDSEVQLTVPATQEMFQKLPVGTFLGLTGSSEIMILETMNIENGNIKFSGISLLPWMNNRFIRTSAVHEDRYWYITGQPGWILWAIIYYMCVVGSPYLNGTYNVGIDNPSVLGIPGLGLRDYDASGANVSVGVPFGPVYDAMKEIAISVSAATRDSTGRVTRQIMRRFVSLPRWIPLQTSRRFNRSRSLRLWYTLSRLGSSQLTIRILL
jgi:hypothetical protein